LGASVLALLFIPNRMLTVVYILFAGHYPIIKLFIEQLDRLWLEWVLKFLYFNLMLIVMYILFKLFVVPSVDSVVVSLVLHYLAVVILALEVIFAFFDWALSHMLSYYDTFLRRIHYE